jgi:hypothetical protein
MDPVPNAPEQPAPARRLTRRIATMRGAIAPGRITGNRRRGITCHWRRAIRGHRRRRRLPARRRRDRGQSQASKDQQPVERCFHSFYHLRVCGKLGRRARKAGSRMKAGTRRGHGPTAEGQQAQTVRRWSGPRWGSQEPLGGDWHQEGPSPQAYHALQCQRANRKANECPKAANIRAEIAPQANFPQAPPFQRTRVGNPYHPGKIGRPGNLCRRQYPPV